MAIDYSVRPVIFFYLTREVERRVVAPILNGLEEEGIPFELKEVSGSANEIAYQAACESSLQVGIGCDDQNLVLHYKNLLAEDPYIVIGRFQSVPKDILKDFGSNCARLVKGMPFKKLNL
jgi:hypothetical protein